ncbi:uncharacterized protein LOC110695345 [Chenopodium quinoa]|uniref:uncharacterized protein LOC110695345 n=1 Tax=Chenopodium quinoa TaxID=63459 RepID=UPI000B76CF26|nr:uncharacterized protein LOC110695345 [Chenopodium quinoa]
MQHDALELVKSLCMEILELDDAKAFSLFQQPLLIAANLGTHEIIEEIVDVFPPAIWASDEENHNVFQLAVLHRRENVFNLIHQMSDYKHLITRYIDHRMIITYYIWLASYHLQTGLILYRVQLYKFNGSCNGLRK